MKHKIMHRCNSLHTVFPSDVHVSLEVHVHAVLPGEWTNSKTHKSVTDHKCMRNKTD